VGSPDPKGAVAAPYGMRRTGCEFCGEWDGAIGPSVVSGTSGNKRGDHGSSSETTARFCCGSRIKRRPGAAAGASPAKEGAVLVHTANCGGVGVGEVSAAWAPGPSPRSCHCRSLGAGVSTYAIAKAVGCDFKSAAKYRAAAAAAL
jgi:hypothetical protein